MWRLCCKFLIMLHPGLKIMPFKLTGYCKVKRRKIQVNKKKNVALQRQMESSQQRQTRLQDISARKAICSQLETLEKRAIIHNFVL